MVSLRQTRDRLGLIKTIARFDAPVDQAEVERKYGSGYYCLKETSPRFRVIWKGWLGNPSQPNDAEKLRSHEIQSLKRKSDYLALGEAVLATGEMLGFGLTASSLANHGQRLNRVETIAAAINARNPLGFVCPECLHPLHDLIGIFCGDCGAKIDWSQRRPTREPTGKLCSHCSYPVGLTQRFCTQCGKLATESIVVFRRLP